MTNNYIKTTNKNYYFFDSRVPAEVRIAYELALSEERKLSRRRSVGNQYDPATKLSIWEKHHMLPIVQEIGVNW